MSLHFCIYLYIIKFNGILDMKYITIYTQIITFGYVHRMRTLEFVVLIAAKMINH